MLHSHLLAKTAPVVNGENTVLWKDFRVSVLADGLFRIEKDSDKVFCDSATQSIWFRNMPRVDFQVKKGETLTVKTAKAALVLCEDVMSSTVTVDENTVMLSKIKNLPGAYRSLDQCNGDMFTDYKDPNKKHKITLEDGIVSECGVGMHNDTKSLILTDDGHLVARDDDELDLYIFAHGKDFRGALHDLYMISGSVPLIPKYAFGNWWSRYHEYTEKEYLHILDSLAERDVPLTVATIDMDWHWSTTLDEKKGITASGKNDEYHGGAKGWTGYSWNTDLFPDYKKFLQKIKDRNLKITLNLHPAVGVRYFEDMYEEMARAMGINPESEQVIPFDFTSDDFINAYFDILHKPYEKDGVEFWWIDWQQGTTTSTPGLDPLWALNHYHMLDNAKEHLPLILSRYCGIGSHRYPLGFSGDTHMTWESLDYIPYFTAMGTNAGYTWWSHDIGGHTLGYKDDELYMRYVQFGVFSPINRLHCTSSNVVTKEPSYFMNGTGMIAEEFLRLRHRMIPLLYSEAYNTHENGQALIEPMYYAYPESADAYNAPGQYMFASKFIVAPITSKGDGKGLATKRVWLPEGKWTDIFTGDEYSGDRWIDMTRWQDTIPVLAGEGAVFVLDGRRHTNNIDNPDLLEVMLFNGEGEYVLHEDKDSARLDTTFTLTASKGKQTLTVHTEGDKSVVPTRTYKLKFKNIRKGDILVLADGKNTEFDFFDAGEYLEVIIENASADVKYTVTVDFTDDRKEYRNARILYNLMRIEGVNAEKSKLSHALKTLSNRDARAFIFEQQWLNDNEKKRLCEAWD